MHRLRGGLEIQETGVESTEPLHAAEWYVCTPHARKSTYPRIRNPRWQTELRQTNPGTRRWATRIDPTTHEGQRCLSRLFTAQPVCARQAANQDPHPSPAEDEGRRPQVGHAHGLRLLDRPHFRRRRYPGAAGRRLRRQRRVRLRHHRADLGRRTDPAGPRRGARRPARAGGRRPAVRQLRGRPGRRRWPPRPGS